MTFPEGAYRSDNAAKVDFGGSGLCMAASDFWSPRLGYLSSWGIMGRNGAARRTHLRRSERSERAVHLIVGDTTTSDAGEEDSEGARYRPE